MVKKTDNSFQDNVNQPDEIQADKPLNGKKISKEEYDRRIVLPVENCDYINPSLDHFIRES
jgi:hypothetical protein